MEHLSFWKIRAGGTENKGRFGQLCWNGHRSSPCKKARVTLLKLEQSGNGSGRPLNLTRPSEYTDSEDVLEDRRKEHEVP